MNHKKDKQKKIFLCNPVTGSLLSLNNSFMKDIEFSTFSDGFCYWKGTTSRLIGTTILEKEGRKVLPTFILLIKNKRKYTLSGFSIETSHEVLRMELARLKNSDVLLDLRCRGEGPRFMTMNVCNRESGQTSVKKLNFYTK